MQVWRREQKRPIRSPQNVAKGTKLHTHCLGFEFLFYEIGSKMIARGSLPSTPFSVLCDTMIRSRSVAYHFTVFIHLLDKGNIFRIFQDLFSSFKPNTERNSIRIIATQTESYTNAASMYYSSGLQFLIMCFTRREKKQSLLYANLV
jgi:hypothetical protein